jgi:hypothetical protein
MFSRGGFETLLYNDLRNPEQTICRERELKLPFSTIRGKVF